MTTNERLVKERISNDLKDHVITIKYSQGLYRHWRCQKPGTWCLGFDIITWPGSLCCTGDMGDYLFQRTDDMVAFMRGSCMSYSYAAEKCVAHDGRLKEWSEERFNQILAERLAEGETVTVFENGGKNTLNVQDIIDNIKYQYSIYNSKHDAEKQCMSHVFGTAATCRVVRFTHIISYGVYTLCSGFVQMS